MGAEAETGAAGERKGVGVGKVLPAHLQPPHEHTGTSSTVRASAEVFLAEVLGVNGAGKGGTAGGQAGLPPGQTPSNSHVPKLAPNKVALTNIVAGVIDHNERVQEEEDAAAHKRLSDFGVDDYLPGPHHTPRMLGRHLPPPPHNLRHHLPPTYDGSATGVALGAYGGGERGACGGGGGGGGAYGYGNCAHSGSYAAYGAPDQSHLFFNRPPPPPAAGVSAGLPHIPPPTLPHALGRAHGVGPSKPADDSGCNPPPPPSARQMQLQGLPTKFK